MLAHYLRHKANIKKTSSELLEMVTFFKGSETAGIPNTQRNTHARRGASYGAETDDRCQHPLANQATGTALCGPLAKAVLD